VISVSNNDKGPKRPKNQPVRHTDESALEPSASVDAEATRTPQEDFTPEIKRLHAKIARMEAEHREVVGGLVKLSRRHRRIAAGVISTLVVKSAIGMSLSTWGTADWSLNAGSGAVGVGVGVALIWPNARKLFTELKKMSSLTAHLTRRTSAPAPAPAKVKHPKPDK
jgi:hypothetical protein